MQRALAILAFAACDAGAAKPAPSPPPTARAIDAAIIEMDAPRAANDVADTSTSAPLQRTAMPAGWEHLMSLLRIPSLELGRSNGAYMLLAHNHGQLFATTFSSADMGEITIDSFRGARGDDGRAAAILIWIDHHEGRHAHAMACGLGTAWSCSAAIPLEDADLKSDLVVSVGTDHGLLEIPATATTPRRVCRIAFL